jgi:hypothetical protein
MGAIHERQVAVEVHPVARQQLIDMAQRQPRSALRDHLGAAGMMSLHDVFRIISLLRQPQDLAVSAHALSRACPLLCAPIHRPQTDRNTSAGRPSLSAAARALS